VEADLLFPQLNQLAPRGAAGVGRVEDAAGDLAACAVGREVRGEGVVELAGEHAAPVLGEVEG